MPNSARLGKHVDTHGLQVEWNDLVLTSSSLTGQLLPPGGMSGNPGGAGSLFVDIYNVNLTSDDSAIEQVTLSDGVSTVTWMVSTSPVNDVAQTPYRFRTDRGLAISASAITSGKHIACSIRGVLSKT
jgi:hypothetical protein